MCVPKYGAQFIWIKCGKKREAFLRQIIVQRFISFNQDDVYGFKLWMFSGGLLVAFNILTVMQVHHGER